MHLLAMDDSKIIQKILPLLLAPIPGVSCDIAANGMEALQFIKNGQRSSRLYDGFLLDLNCPGFLEDPEHHAFAGLQMIAILRRDNRRPNLGVLSRDISDSYKHSPILVFTTETEDRLINAAMGGGQPAFGANRVLQKAEYLAMGAQQKFRQLLGEIFHAAVAT